MIVKSLVVFFIIIELSVQQELSDLLKRLGCPKGWTHLGGSCYYLPNNASTSTSANQTCHQHHSTRAHLIQIDNSVELFYAASILQKAKLPELLIEINQNSTKISQRMKRKYLEHRLKYYELKEQIIEQFKSAGIRLGRSSTDIQKSVHKQYPNLMYESIDWDTYEISTDYNMTSWLFPKNTTDNLNFLDNLPKICHQIKWNITDKESKIYTLSTSSQSNEIICWLNNIKVEKKYPHLCEYVMDYCFANDVCGRYGRCMNTISDYKCYCSFLHEGVRCEKISKQGKQIIIGSIVLVVYSFFVLIYLCAKNWKKPEKRSYTNILPKQINKHDCIRIWCVFTLASLFCLLSTIFIWDSYMKSFKNNLLDKTTFDQIMKQTALLVAKRGILTDCRLENLIFCPFALILILIFSFVIKRTKVCIHSWDNRSGVLLPFLPFRTSNRFTTAAIFGIIAYKILRLTEELLFSATSPLSRGVFYEMLDKIALFLVIGLRYYPVLASLQFRNLLIRCLTCFYLFADLLYTIIRERSCISFLPLSRYYAPFEEAKLRNEMGNWFFAYGLIKNAPHFILLSCVFAEICIRIVYDSVHLKLKGKQQPNESLDVIFAKQYVVKLFRSADPSTIVYFPYPTIVICAYTVASIFVYYVFCTLVFVYILRTTNHASFLTYMIERIFHIEYQGYFPIRTTILISGITTVLVYIFYLLFSLQNYQIHRNQIFRQVNDHIRLNIDRSNFVVFARSLRYFGYLSSYMTCGFLVWFHFIFFILLTMKIIALQIPFIEFFFAICLPLIIISSTIDYIIAFLTYVSFSRNYTKFYTIILYIAFLFDCVFGILTCFLQLILKIFMSIFLMARFDMNIDGKCSQELGTNVYVTYLHMENAHTNPILIAFCHLIYEEICRRRPKNECHHCCLSVTDSPDCAESTGISVRWNRYFGEALRRRKLCRFRWFRAYTLIHNRTLFESTANKKLLNELYKNGLMSEPTDQRVSWDSNSSLFES